MPTIASAGSNDATFIQELRDEIEDPPIPVDESFSSNGTATRYRIARAPAWDADQYLAVTVGVIPYNVVTSRDVLAGTTDVYVEPDTGVLYFQSAPPAGSNNIVVNHYTVRFLDRRLRASLYAGMRAMFPSVWQEGATTFQLAVNQWEYTLTPLDFRDPRTKIYRVEVQEIPATTERYHVISSWRQIGYNVLHMPTSQWYSPNATVRVSYIAPYRSLGDLESQVRHLPLLYAKGKLLLEREVPRSRADVANITQAEGANPVGTSMNVGLQHLQEFDHELARLTRPLPVARPISSYAL